MTYKCNRREFIGAAGISTMCIGGLDGLARSFSLNGNCRMASVHVLFGDGAREDDRSRTWRYIEEIFARAGIFYRSHYAADLDRAMRTPGCILVLAGDLLLTAKQRGSIVEWVKNGGLLLGLGGSSGLTEVFGVKAETALAEGWIRPAKQPHPILQGLLSSLHVFGGRTLMPSGGTVLAGIEGGSAYVKGSAIVENLFGKGRAVLIGPDVIFSIVHIQQGLPVFQDAKPSPDSSAGLNDGILKAEDGFVLDWARDRSAVQPEGSIFLEPVTDELRELILRSLFYLASESGSSLPLLWQWPGKARAVAMMSHDTDGNEPAKAGALLDVVKRCGIKTTWCILYPGGYPKQFYRQLVKEDCEVALHYDALGGGEKTSWSWQNFVFQQQWLMREAEVNRIVTNKNHYTRWEGRLDLWRWCERAGIRADQTRGPSKKGTIGFPLGGSQPYYPLDDSSKRPRLMDVLEVNLLTQDHVVTCPPEYGPQLVESVLRHNGVAHFLFHPAHIQKPGVTAAFENLVEQARSQGLEWWTSSQIVDWEQRRRSIKGRQDRDGLHIAAAREEGATLLMLRPGGREGRVEVNGDAAATTPWRLYGFEFSAIRLPAGHGVRVGWSEV